MNTDVVIIGGGAAGTTAALVLARARHHVTLIDDRTYRNATVDEFHGFPTRDSTAPDTFRHDARHELHHYGVRLIEGTVTDASATDRIVTITVDDHTTVDAAATLIATGVIDQLPAIAGLAVRWGKSIFNCPFCDGWERRDQPVVVIDAAPGAADLARLLSSWTTQITIIEANDIIALVGDGSTLERVEMRDSRSIPATAAFLTAPVIPRSDIAADLGCDLDDAGYILTDYVGATSHPIVWAAGDVRHSPPAAHHVVLAAADGSTAGIAIHTAFVHGATSAIGRW